MTVVLIFIFIFILTVVVMAHVMAHVVMTRHNMTVGVVTVKVVAYGMIAPVGMNFFPVMPARQSVGIQTQPDIAGTQIIILAADNADIFDTIPDVSIRNRYVHCYCWWRWCRDLNCHHGCRNLHHYRWPGHQWQSREARYAHHNNDFFCSFHTSS